jgi:hypothetical protein
MLVSRKLAAPLLAFSALTSGCGVVEFVETPESWGTRAGEYGAEQWMKEGESGYPSSNAVAAYCVSIGESGQKEFNWTVKQTYESTMACTDAFVRGLE